MITYSFRVTSKIDINLTNAWKKWYDHNPNRDDWKWEDFIKSLPGVEAVRIRDDRTLISFNDESAFSMFLLRWS